MVGRAGLGRLRGDFAHGADGLETGAHGQGFTFAESLERIGHAGRLDGETVVRKRKERWRKGLCGAACSLLLSSQP